MNTIEMMPEKRVGKEVVQSEGSNGTLFQTEDHRKPGESLHKVPAEESDTDEESRLPSSVSRSRKCKARRARRKAYRPYYQLTEGERDIREENERLRLVRLKERMRAKGRIIAPYNTTQFLLADHHDDTLKLLEKKLQVKNGEKEDVKENIRSRTIDEEYYNSSPTDEEEDFISKEFKKDYDIQHVNRLEKMSKEMLLNEYMIVERKNEVLEARLENIQNQEEEKAKRGEADYEFHKGEVPMEPEMAQKIKVFQNEINLLKAENQRLLKENMDIKDRLRQNSESSSISSSSDSSSSSSSEDSDTESDEEDMKKQEKNTGLPEDTGYESTQSREGTPERSISIQTEERK